MGVRELSRPPSMKVLYPRAVAGAGRSVIRRLPGLGTGEPRLPDEELKLGQIEIDRDHLAAYARVCGFRVDDTLPATYPHVLTFPLAMQLMTEPGFPFPVMGLVHVRNQIVQLRPIRADQSIALKVRTSALADHERGTQFEVLAQAWTAGDDDLAWRSASTYLHREGDGRSSSKDGAPGEPPARSAVWELPADTGRRYAEVSGDRNPIHLHPLSARLFGLPRPIAHGMWLKAHCLAALESLLPERFDVDVRFKLPVFLPSKVSFASWGEDHDRAFALHDAKNEKPHLTGTVRPP